MEKAIKFENYNDWLTCRVGKAEIIVDFNGRISHLYRTRGKPLITDEAEKWVDEKWFRRDLNEWKIARENAIAKWRHETPHHRFECDGGSLAVRVNGCVTLHIGCGADGNHPLYIVKGALPPFFKPCGGISLDECTIEPLDYDCDGGNPLCKVAVKNAWFYRHESAIAIVIEAAKVEG